MNAHVLGIITIMVLLPRFMSYCNRNAYKYKSKLSKQQFILYHSSIESTKLNEPIDFNSNFQLPITGEIFPLQYQNSHPLDKSLTFDEITHKYTYSNIVIKKSVTQLISNYFDKFIPEVEAVKMVKSKNWPRPQYLLPNNVPFSVDEILQCWSQNGEYARNRGTWMHYNIERFLNGLEPIGDLPEFQLFLKCYNDYIIQQNITPYRTEWRIVAPDIQLAGSVDFVGKKEDGSLVIMDWKRSKNLQDKLVNNYGKKAK